MASDPTIPTTPAPPSAERESAWKAFLSPSVLQWLEPPVVRRQRPGEAIPIGKTSMTFAVFLTAVYLLLRWSQDVPLDAATVGSAVAFGVLCAFGPMAMARFMPLPVRLMPDSLVAIRVTAPSALPAFALVRVWFDEVASFDIVPTTHGDKLFDTLELRDEVGSTVWTVGLGKTTRRHDLIEWLVGLGTLRYDGGSTVLDG